MKAILILAGPFSSCDATKIIWKEACATKDIKLETLDLTLTEGQEIANKLKIKSFPALIINNKVVAVGHPNKSEDALKIIGKI